jgi:hypothetical protein
MLIYISAYIRRGRKEPTPPHFFICPHATFSASWRALMPPRGTLSCDADLWACIDTVRPLKNAIFEACITDEARRLFA